MTEGESGLMNVGARDFRPNYEPSKRRVTWPNGAVATLFSADEPERLRGPQCEFLWVDEPGSWRYPATWDNAMLGLRLGPAPRWMATFTPRRTPLIRKLLAYPNVVLTRGSTYDNRANLAGAFFDNITRQYEGTTLGRQELNAELLTEVPGAVFNQDVIEKHRVQTCPPLKRVGVAVDPSVSDNENSAEMGIIAGGVGLDNHLYILEDASLRGSPNVRAAKAVNVYRDRMADAMVIEENNGGDWIPHAIHTIDGGVNCVDVRASRGKLTRAEPIGGLYEQGKVHHVGLFPLLEDQMTSWVPGEASPDRMDALVWLATSLMLTTTHKKPESFEYA